MFPCKVRHRPSANLMTGESRKTIDEISQLIRFGFVLPPQVMPGIRYVNDPLVSCKLLPIEIERVRSPVEIVSSVDDQFGQGQPVAILPGIKHDKYALAL